VGNLRLKETEISEENAKQLLENFNANKNRVNRNLKIRFITAD